jgi:hypothetical protein
MLSIIDLLDEKTVKFKNRYQELVLIESKKPKEPKVKDEPQDKMPPR